MTSETGQVISDDVTESTREFLSEKIDAGCMFA